MAKEDSITPLALSLLVADDHPVFRFGLAELLGELNIVKNIDQAENGNEAIHLIQKKKYDIIFLDLEMPVKNGIDMLTDLLLLNLKNAPRVIISSSYCDHQKIVNAFERGIQGYILKNTSLRELTRALLLVADGEQYFSKEIASHLFKHLLKTNKNGYKRDLLSLQEKKVLEYICLQLSNPEIAEKMCLSEKTIKRHRYNIKEKIGAKNTVGLVVYAIQEGIFRV